MKKSRVLVVFLFSIFTFTADGISEENTRPGPAVFLNGVPANVTVQDLSGIGTRPLRLLVHRNNKAHGKDLIRVFAAGVRNGDAFTAVFTTGQPGVRTTVYRIFREHPDGPRYVSMTASVYFDAPRSGEFRERITSEGEEFLIFVQEKTDAPDEKNIQVRYFEERVRRLVITSFRTNLIFSSLKLKMKDYGGEASQAFFERDAQTLIDRLVRPQEIVLLRLWKIHAAQERGPRPAPARRG